MTAENLKREFVVNGKTARVVETVVDERLGYEYDVLGFTHRALAEEMDACHIRIRPGGRTSIYEIVSQTAQVTDHVIKGKGRLIRSTPDGKIETEEINAGVETSTFHYTPGTIFVWVAERQEGLEIVGTNVPPLSKEPDQERELDIDDPAVPEQFRILIRGSANSSNQSSEYY